MSVLCLLGLHRWRRKVWTCPGDCDHCRDKPMILEHGHYYDQCARCGKRSDS